MLAQKTEPVRAALLPCVYHVSGPVALLLTRGPSLFSLQLSIAPPFVRLRCHII